MSDKEAIKEIEAYLGKNDYKKTLELANIFLKRNPDNNLVFLYKGSALFWLKKYPEAIEIYTEAATKRLPDKPHSWRFLARCYKVQEMYKEAIKYYEISLEKDPKYESSLKELEFCIVRSRIIRMLLELTKLGLNTILSIVIFGVG
ncbi:MAG: tetratricopeptide repeat protein [Candidatus Heimdallarchaeota archaeon]|nr:tetratricopeptide repeat protein [Candidatus Heimdallarchaeota archaeon]MCG3253887.1 tetratricopeptide repeat protein [Candidatus Heimdallarchaeota archaeon]MCK4291020.1 tetratricopeptide repeat protein [Candidatus Heimdallarchaeota archaeon]